MRRLILIVLTIAGLSGPLAAQDQDDEIKGVIQSQIDAFLADDFATAFTFASPSIQQFFQSSDRFGLMVREGYPMVWRPADVDFLETEPRGPFEYQKVLITDEAGVPHVLEYQMIRSEGGWQINGVRILREGALGA